MKKRQFFSGLMAAASALAFSVCCYAAPDASYNWDTTDKKYENFTDLGHYAIDLDPHETFDLQRAMAYAEKRYANITPIGCTALGTKTDKGDVIIGRNCDLEVSNRPCYISHVKYGKYETINFTYDKMSTTVLDYADVLADGKLDKEYYNFLPLLASDSMNSEGLYLEYNMRDKEEMLTNTGTNPKAKLRMPSLFLPFMVASHCANIEEALKYMKEELDIYTARGENYEGDNWNMCMMIGDATGRYGLIEIANNQIHFIPHQHGQGNYYIWPAFNAISQGESGHGRFQYGLERIESVQSDEEMAAMMEKIMWKHEILDIPYACRDEYGTIHFYADPEHKVESIDWRSDQVQIIPVNAEGKYIDVDENTPEAKLVRGYKKQYNDYKAGIDKEKNKAGHDKYNEYLNRNSLIWAHSDKNFEALQKGLIKYYTETGIFDKLKKYYAGDEAPLRADGTIWTTGMSFSVNCTQKRMTLKLWEEPDTVLHYQW